VLDGRRGRDQALARYAAFSDGHERKFRWLLQVQRAVGQTTRTRALNGVIHAFENRRLAAWTFERYLAIAPPSFAGVGPVAAASRSSSARASRRMPSSIAGSARLA
jgi:menaquinone-9 beta-reductase